MRLNKFVSIFAVGLVILAMTSCSDIVDEIKSLTFDRNFSPTGIEASNIKETSATITWNPVKGATNYTLEVYADDNLTFAGIPEQIITGLTENDIPYTLENLLFDTEYSVRIQALTEGDVNRTSTWNGATFKTTAKQFLKNPKLTDVQDRSVTLTWDVEEGYDVTTIVIGDITHEITPEEKEASQATIDGLSPETTYTAYLYYNGKQCGNRNFTTIADLEGATVVMESDDLKKLIESEDLEENAVFALMPGTYELNVNDDGKTGAVRIKKSITIKGIFPTAQPVIKGRFQINDGAGLNLSQVKIDATNNATTDQIFIYKIENAEDGLTYGPLNIQSCEITGVSTGKGFIFMNGPACDIQSITINNSIVSGIECSGGDFIDFRTGYPQSLNITNSTFNNVASARDFIRIDDSSGKFTNPTPPVVIVDHCTLYKVGKGGGNYRLLYVRFKGNDLTFTNSIVVGTTNKRGFANGSYNPASGTASEQAIPDPDPTLSGNFYYDCVNLTSPSTTADANISWFDTDSNEYDKTNPETGYVTERGKGNGVVLDSTPFINPGSSFTLDANSKAYAAGAGDPRWLGE